jgi:hypothetical protein
MFAPVQSPEQPAVTLADELQACRALAARCCFVIGYGRSGTTLLADIINSNDRALMTGEAHYFIRHGAPRFRDWFNAQTAGFQNQVTKLTHAPDFIPEADHTWWQWLTEAARYFDLVGDKVALSDYYFSLAPPETILSFFEARFFDARYVFTIRNPLDTLASAAITFRRDSEDSLVRLMVGWLTFVQFWADFVRVFPNTVTILFDRFDAGTVDALSAFIGLDLSAGKAFIDRAPRKYDLSALAGGGALKPYESQLSEVFERIATAVDAGHASLRRSAQRADDPTRLGCERAWSLADQMLCALREHQA